MQWITIIILGIAANLDNLGVGLAYGVKKTKIPFVSNFIIALVSMIVTFVSVTTGSTITQYISITAANLLGSLLLCLVGIWMLIPFKKDEASPLENPELIDTDGNHIVSFREAIILGFILSANCLASGVGMGVNGVSVLWTVFSIGFFSIVTIGASSYFGAFLSKTILGKYPTKIAGGLLISIGIFEVFV